MRAGTTFRITTPDNITTPYEWKIDPTPDERIVALEASVYSNDPSHSCAGCAGAGGVRTFTFSARGAGKISLHFIRVHVGSVPGAAVAEHTVTVAVDP
ncbi:MAG: protease inhibitor I42 family protein [Polyangiales bacterium]